MSYYKDLAFALRMRGLSEERIRTVLGDTAAIAREARRDPVEEFGSAAAYAERFEAQKRSTRGRKFTTTVVVLALSSMVILFIAGALLDFDLRVGFISVPLGVAVLLSVIALIGGFALDHGLPRGFEEPESKG